MDRRTRGNDGMDSLHSWLILACSLTCLFLTSLLGSSMAIVQVDMMEDLQLGSGIVSIVTSLAVGLQNLLGPLSGAMGNALSLRCTILVGIIFISLGLMFISFSRSLAAMVVFSIMTGCGNGLSFSACIVVINHHFEKRRLFANGILLCAPGIAHVVWPYLLRYSIDTHGWRLCLAINAAIILHVSIFAMAFEPTAVERKGMITLNTLSCFRKRRCNDDDNEEENQTDFSTKNSCKGLKAGIKQDALLSARENKTKIQNDIHYVEITDCTHHDIKLHSTTSLLNSDTRHIESLSNINIVTSNENLPPYEDTKATRLFSATYHPTHYTESKNTSSLQQNHSKSLSHLNEYVSRDYETCTVDRFRSHCILSPSEFQDTGKSNSGLGFTRSKMGSDFCLSSSTFEQNARQLHLNEETLNNLDHAFQAQMHRIFHCTPVWILSVSCLFYLCGCSVQLLHFPAFVISKGMTAHQVSTFYTVFGVAVILGRFLGGVVYNRFNPPLLPLFCLLQLVTGVCLGMAPFYATQPAGVYVLEVSFALSFGHGFMVLAPLVAQIVGVQDLGVAFGIVQLFNGIGYTGSPILAGFVYDATGTYDVPMYIAGAFCLLASIVILFMIVVHGPHLNAHKTTQGLSQTTDSVDVSSCADVAQTQTISQCCNFSH